MKEETKNGEIKEFYFRKSPESFVVIAYFIELDKHLKVELSDKRVVTSISIIDGFNKAYTSTPMLKELGLKEANKYLGINEDEWSEFMTKAIIGFVEPITSLYGIGSAFQILKINDTAKEQKHDLKIETREDWTPPTSAEESQSESNK